MKILWLSNAPWVKTGYGGQTDLFWWRIQKLGHEVKLVANWGLNGAPLNIQSPDGTQATQVYPNAFHAHGADVLAPYAENMKADIVITLYDTWVFPPETTGRFRWCPWMPVDHEPLPERVKFAVQSAWQPICYSRYGQQMMLDAGFSKTMYVPHGVDSKVFQPYDQADCRKKMTLPEYDFLMLMVAANKGAPSRKCFPEVLDAFSKFLVKHPKALLYMHTDPGIEMGGVDLVGIVRAMGIPNDRVVFPNWYWMRVGYSSNFMAHLMSAADVLVSPSAGEGFGVPILEAQACGCPVITGNWTSMPELTFSGWKVQGQRFWSPLGAWQYTPRVDAIVEAMEAAFEARGNVRMKIDAREQALAYDADLVAQDYWGPTLERIAAEVTGSGEDMLEMVDVKGAVA